MRSTIRAPFILCLWLFIGAAFAASGSDAPSSWTTDQAPESTTLALSPEPVPLASVPPPPALQPVAPQPGLPPSETGAASGDAEPVPVPLSEPEPEPAAVTIAFGGDVHFEGSLRSQLETDPQAILQPIGAMMADTDIAMINLETAVTERGVPAPKQFVFRVGPSAFDALRAAGIDLVTVANNHGLDYGQDGLDDTIKLAAEANFPIVGIGRDATEAYSPWVGEVHGQSVAILGATQVLDTALEVEWTATDDAPGLASAKREDRLLAEVERAAERHDIVVVFLHWGVEGQQCPSPAQQGLADGLIDAGADVIVGGHAHRLQGGGLKRGAYVHYGLGNFVFNSRGGLGSESGVLRVTMRQGTVESSEWIPARLNNGVATKLEGESSTAALAAWEELRACTDLEDDN